MKELVQSMKERGIITPVILRKKEDGRYEITNSVLVASLLVEAIILLVGIRVFPLALRIPKHILLPVVLDSGRHPQYVEEGG